MKYKRYAVEWVVAILKQAVMGIQMGARICQGVFLNICFGVVTELRPDQVRELKQRSDEMAVQLYARAGDKVLPQVRPNKIPASPSTLLVSPWDSGSSTPDEQFYGGIDAKICLGARSRINYIEADLHPDSTERASLNPPAHS